MVGYFWSTKLFESMILRFLENPFDTEKLSREELNNLAKKHVAYLTQQNQRGLYDDVLGIVQPKAQAFTVWYEQLGSTASGKSSQTMLVEQLLDALEDKVDDLHDEVTYKFRKSRPAVYEDFFPNGKTPFLNMRRTAAAAQVKSLLLVCNKHIAELTADKVRALQSALDAFISALEGQTEAKGEMKESSHDGTHLRAELALALYQGLIRLLNIHINDPEAIKTLYDAKHLNLYRKKADAVPTEPEGQS